MRSQRFGVEIELTGITRCAAAKVVAGYFSTQATHIGGVYDTYIVRDCQDRQWKIVYDASIRREARGGRNASGLYSVELVTPICTYEDIVSIQEITRKLREAGGKVNSSCGIHVHVDASNHTPQTLRNIVNIMAAKEDLLYKALRINVDRERYCKKTDMRFLEDLNRFRPKTTQQLNQIWYNGRDRSHYHYDDSRYHGLNLHNVFGKGTVEFRLFNSTLHAGEVKSYVQICLAISNQALNQRSASYTRTQSDNEKYTFRTWLLRLGLIGDDFKTARLHLLKNLDGNIAWKDPAQAEAQKQRRAEQLQKQAEQENPDTEQTAEYDEPEVEFGLNLSM